MMAWLFLALFALVALGLIWRFGQLPKGGLEFAIAAVIIGVGGYAWQGKPDQPGTSVAAKDTGIVPPDLADAASRAETMNRYGDAARVIEFSDTLGRMGLTREAVIAVKTGMRKEPDNVDLWVGLGNALVQHGGGQLSPAAEYAYNRGAQLSPEHPAPPFFLGLALAKSGRLADAAEVWRQLLARTPPDAPWRADLEQRLSEVAAVSGS